MPALDRAKTLQAAERFVRAGKLLEAVKEYQKLADDNPRDMNVVNKLGDLLLRAGRTPEALKQFMRIADYFAKDGFHLKAIAMYKKISKIDGTNLECQERLAALYWSQGLATEAKAQYLHVADGRVRAGQATAAIDALRKVLEIEPDNVKIRLHLADLLGRAAKPDEAAVEYGHVARVAAERGAVDETVQIVRKAIKISPAHRDLAGILLSVVTRVETAPAELVTAAEEIARHAARSSQAVVLVAETLRRAGRVDDAEKALKRLGEESFDDELEADALVAVGGFHSGRGRAEEAFEWLERGVQRLLLAERLAAAVGAVDSFLARHPQHPRALQRRVELAAKAGDAGSEAEALLKLTPVLMETGERDKARDTLQRLAALRPGDSAVAELQDRLQGGGAAPSPAGKPKGASHAPAPEPVETMPSARGPEPGAAGTRAESEDAEAAEIFNLDDNEDAGIEIAVEPAADEDAPAIEIETGAATTEEVDYGPKSRIQEIQDSDPSGQPIDDEFISEHLTEAEVFVKYGLFDKAREQLRQVLKRYPQHDVAHLRMKDIAVSEGNKDAGVRACLALAGIRRAQGKEDEARDLINEAVKIDPDHAELASFTKAQPGAPRIVPAPPPAAPPEPVRTRAAATPAPALIDDLEIEIDLSDDEPEPIAAAPAPAPAARPASTPAPAPRDVSDFATTTARTVKPPEPDSLLEEETSDDLEVLREALSDPDSEKLGEVDFYIEQGLVDEARQVLFQLKKRFPGSAAVEERIERLEKPRAAAAANPAGAPEEDDVDFEVEQALAGKKGTAAKSVASPAKSKGPAARTAAKSAAPAAAKSAAPAASKGAPKASPVRPVFKVETPVEDDNGDFFDLAGELESTLAEEQTRAEASAKDSLDGQAHTFEDIFAAFRKGVEQQVDSDDFDTHYNLGIAYKEMGLVDEAIGEFQFAARDPNRALECCGILGLCFRDKGMPDLALKWYKRGLDMPGLEEEQAVGFRYDMAEVYRDKGEFDEALRMYTEVYGVDSTYREVSSRIKEMKSQLTQSGKR